MVNATGRNGTDNGTGMHCISQWLLSEMTLSSVPPDDQLEVALRMYEVEGLPIKERLGRLEAEFSYCIKSLYYYCKCYAFTNSLKGRRS